MNETPNPTPLRVVAGLFVFAGVCAVIEMIVGLFCRRLSLNLSVLCLWIGRRTALDRRGCGMREARAYLAARCGAG